MSHLFEEVGDSQSCWAESCEVTHVIPDTHPLEPLFLSLVPCPMTFSLCQDGKSYHIKEACA